jgi:hypothetical protein
LSRSTQKNMKKTTFQEIKNDPAFQRGVQKYKDGKVRMPSITPMWVKKLVGKRDWNSYYSKVGTYCFLGEKDEKIMIGFCIGSEKLPVGLEPLTLEEERRVDEYRRACSIRPFVFQVV